MPKTYAYGQTEEQRRRLAHVILWLEEHAERFNMSDFISNARSGESIVVDDIKGATKAFESCGTTVCLAGAAVCLYPEEGFLGSRISFNSSGKRLLGVPEDLFYSSTWSDKNRDSYFDAKDEGDYRGMVAAAKQQCIDLGVLDA